MKHPWEHDGDFRAGWTEMCKLLASEDHPEFVGKSHDEWMTLKRRLQNSKLIAARPVSGSITALSYFVKEEVVLAVRRLTRGETGTVEQLFRSPVGREHMARVRGQYAQKRKSFEGIDEENEPDIDPAA